MALDTRAKRAAAAHVKKPGKGVTPDATPQQLWRASVGWSYAFDEAPPPTGQVVDSRAHLGATYSPGPGLGGAWGW